MKTIFIETQNRTTLFNQLNEARVPPYNLAFIDYENDELLVNLLAEGDGPNGLLFQVRILDPKDINPEDLVEVRRKNL